MNKFKFMDLRKALANYLVWQVSGEDRRYYEPRNLSKGLCKYCDNKLYRKGYGWVNCEYHYLKKKYRTISDRCREANETNITPAPYPYLRRIKCKISWEQFLAWCIVNPQYRKMKAPAIIRIDKKKHFDFGNIEWSETKNNLGSKTKKK